MKYFFRILLLIVVLSVLLMGYISGSQITRSFTDLVTPQMSGENVTEVTWKNAGFDFEAFRKAYAIEEFTLTSSFEKHEIPVVYVNASEEPDHVRDTVIMLHDLGGNKETMFPAAKVFLEMGYNVIAFDQRSHGENTAKHNTFGYLEKYDLLDCMDYAKREIGSSKLGIYAESYGSLAAAQALGYESRWHDADFAIFNSPIKDMKSQVRPMLDSYSVPLPKSLLYFNGNLICRMKHGFFFSDASAVKAVRTVNIPILIINSEADSAVSYKDGKDIYNAIPNKQKKIWTVLDSEHLEIAYDHYDEYVSRIKSFLGK